MVGGGLADNDVSRIGKKDRPRGLATVAILQMVVGFLAFAADLCMHYLFTVSPSYGNPGGGAGVAEVFIMFGLVIAGAFSLVLGYGIWKGWSWTWLTVVILDILGIMFSILTLFGVISQTSVPSLSNYAFSLSFAIPVVLVCSIELWYFSRERTRGYFVKWKQSET